MHGNRKSHDPLAIRSARDRCTFRSLHQPPWNWPETKRGWVLLSYFSRRFYPALFTFCLFSSLSLSLSHPHTSPCRRRRHRRRDDGDDSDDDDGDPLCTATLNYLQTLKRGGKTEPTTLRCSRANVDDPAPFSVNVHSS